MANRLKELKVTKVDFVDAGDNKRAGIKFCKRAPEEAGEPPGGQDGVLKRVLAAVVKAMGAEGAGTQAALAAVSKEATSFDGKVAEEQRRATADEIWRVCWLLQDSLCSIFWDDGAVDKARLMEQSLAEFEKAVRAAIPAWADGGPAQIAKDAPPLEGERLEMAKARLERLRSEVNKAGEAAPEPETKEAGRERPGGITKGETKNMRFDKSKLTPEEAAALEAIEKKAGIPEAEPPAVGGETVPTAKSTPAGPADGGDIYKGLHPAVAEELKALRKRADAAEERELLEVAKKYEIVGKKAEELMPVLKSLKAAGGSAYQEMLSVLDAGVEAMEKSGLFREIGKSGGGAPDPWSLIEKHADEIMKAAPTLSRAEAVDKACAQHPELVYEYENGRN